MAEFRSGTAAMRNDPQVVELIDRLMVASPEFAEWWPQLDVAQFQTRLRRYAHPRAGDLVFEYQQLTPERMARRCASCASCRCPGDDSAARLAAWRYIA